MSQMSSFQFLLGQLIPVFKTGSRLNLVLLQDDPEWFWVLRSDGLEGFVPAGFVYPLDAIQKQRK